MAARDVPRARRTGAPSRVLSFLALLGLLLALGTPAASAHAYLASSNPADGATLDAAPSELRLGFSEHVVLNATRITVVDGTGRRVPVTHVRLVTDSPDDTEEPAEIVADLPVLPHGSYRVTWRTLSSDDLHSTSGLLVFGLGTQVRAAAQYESPPAPDQSVLDAFFLLGLSLALGAPLAQRVLAGRGAGDVRRVLTAVARGGAVLALATTVLLPLGEAAGGAGWSIMTTGSYGLRWAGQATGLVLLLVHHLLSPRRRPRRAVLVSGAGLAALGHALLGHAAAGAGADHLVRVAAAAVHLVAALTWAGAVGCLAVALTAARLGAHVPVPSLRSTLRGFAGPAAACVSTATVSGVYLASHVVVSLDAVVDTIYGRLLLLKLGVAATVGLLALVNHRRLRGPRDLDVPRRTLLAEAGALLLVLGVTAVLATGQPATQDRLVDAGPPPSNGLVTGQVGHLAETLKVRPNRPGAAVVLIDVFDTRRPAPGPVSEVSVGVGDRSPSPATPLGDGHWSLDVPELMAGSLPVRVSVTEAGTTSVSRTYEWVVGPGAGTPAAHLSRAPIAPALRLGSGLLAAVLAVAWGVALRRSSRRRLPKQSEVPPGSSEVDVNDLVRQRDGENRCVRTDARDRA